MLKTLHLFAGAGGGILADRLLQHQPIAAVEIVPWLQQGLLPWRFPELLNHTYGDIRTFDARKYCGAIDCVSGGFPCQDLSIAGKGAGLTGERSGLWKEFVRVISEVKPKQVFIENSPNLINKGLNVVLENLCNLGYSARWGIIGAHHTGAPHKRLRCWVVATRLPDGFIPTFRNVIGHKLPQWGFMRGGVLRECWPPALIAQQVYLPTPCVLQRPQEGNTRMAAKQLASGNFSLEEAAILCGKDPREGHGKFLPHTIIDDNKLDYSNKTLNPDWQEALMGWPAGWTDLCQKNEEIPPVKKDWQSWEVGIPRITNYCKAHDRRLAAIGNGQSPQCAAFAFTTLSKEL